MGADVKQFLDTPVREQPVLLFSHPNNQRNLLRWDKMRLSALVFVTSILFGIANAHAADTIVISDNGLEKIDNGSFTFSNDDYKKFTISSGNNIRAISVYGKRLYYIYFRSGKSYLSSAPFDGNTLGSGEVITEFSSGDNVRGFSFDGETASYIYARNGNSYLVIRPFDGKNFGTPTVNKVFSSGDNIRGWSHKDGIASYVLRSSSAKSYRVIIREVDNTGARSRRLGQVPITRGTVIQGWDWNMKTGSSNYAYYDVPIPQPSGSTSSKSRSSDRSSQPRSNSSKSSSPARPFAQISYVNRPRGIGNRCTQDVYVTSFNRQKTTIVKVQSEIKHSTWTQTDNAEYELAPLQKKYVGCRVYSNNASWKIINNRFK